LYSFFLNSKNGQLEIVNYAYIYPNTNLQISMDNQLQQTYIQGLNKALIFIDNNLNKPLTLEQIAETSNYSPYHFHRIFKAITGETLNNYINRLRIEKIASILMRVKTIPLEQLAIDYGFNSGSSLSRSFKKFYGISPSRFRDMSNEQFSKIRQTESKNGQEKISFEQYICNITNLNNWIKMNANIEVKELPKIELAYVNHQGPFDQIGVAYGQLMQWAGPQGLMSNPNTKTLTIYHDDPKVTDTALLRQSACITLHQEIKTSGAIGKRTISKGKFAIGRFEINFEEFEQSWNGMFLWITEKGYQTRDGEYFEMYHNNFNDHPEKKCIVDICIPII